MNNLSPLSRLQARLAPLTGSVSIRGEGPAAFVFAEGRDRAAEVTREGDGWSVELWDRGPGGDPPVRDLTLATEGEVVAAFAAWLG